METITLTVNTTVDENDGSESGTGLSLREAIDITNQTPENDYIIELRGGSTYALEVNSDDPEDNHLDLVSNVTIRASGEQRAVIDASGLAEPDIVLHVSDDSNVNLENLTITGGAAEGEGITLGGGILIDKSSTVNITDSLITGNTAEFVGGGIFADVGSSVSLVDSEVTNNQSGDSGGGISVFGAEVNVYSSSISENAAGFTGGGIDIDGNSESEPIVVVVNSTISDNTAENSGGGIHLNNFDASKNSAVEISNSTIVNNIANADGGGIRTRQSNSIAIKNSIIAGNFAAGGDIPSDVYGLILAVPQIFDDVIETTSKSIIGDGNNLIGTFDPSDVSGTIGTGSDLVNVDPLLTPIENSNGTVVAYALSEGSPAIDAGSNANIPADRLDLDSNGNIEEPVATDQLGNERIANNAVDIGAVEFGALAIADSSINPNSSREESEITDDDVALSPLELRENTAQIAFVAYYGRPADKGGLNFWNGALGDNEVSYAPREGDSLTGSKADIYNQIVNAFGNSEEAERLFGNFSNDRDKVNQVYRFAFDRDGDSEGLDFWTEQIDLGNVTLATFALEVALGAQNEDIVVLNNKIESADLFTNSIDTSAETEAYQGSEAEVFGRDWLGNYGLTVSNQSQVNSALTELVG